MKRTLLTYLTILCFVVTAISQTTFSTKKLINGSTGNGPYVINSGNLDNDTNIDIVIGTDIGNTVEWCKNNGNGTFTKQTNLTTTLTNVEGIHIADLDNDLDNDILASGYGNDKLVWFENIDGDGTFSSENVISSTVDGAGSIFTGNIDNDINIV